MELRELMKILQQIKVAWGTASLTFLVREGKTKARLEVELDSEPEPPPPLHLQLNLALTAVVDDVLEVDLASNESCKCSACQVHM